MPVFASRVVSFTLLLASSAFRSIFSVVVGLSDVVCDQAGPAASNAAMPRPITGTLKRIIPLLSSLGGGGHYGYLQPPCESENQHDQKHQPQPAAGVIAP